MEIIRKKICFDKLLSRKNGIMPYIKKDSDSKNINYVVSNGSEGNYGSFPCDFALIKYYSDFDIGTDIPIRKKHEVARLRYLDVNSWYSECLNIVKGGKIFKKIPYISTETTHITCTENGNEEETVQLDNVAWIEVKDDSISRYDCVLFDSSFLENFKNDIYILERLKIERFNSLKQAYGTNVNNVPEEERKFFKKMKSFVGNGSNGPIYTHDYLFVIGDYDTYKEREDRWNLWWEKTWERCTSNPEYDTNIVDDTEFDLEENNDRGIPQPITRWEQHVFDMGYIEPVSMKFMYDVDKYVIGSVFVPEKYGDENIDGNKVPNMVYYLNYMDYLDWFTEYQQYLGDNNEIFKEWNDRGGYPMKNFLMSITPRYPIKRTEPTAGTVVDYTFVVPNVEIGISICDEFYNETSYVPYEYSIDDEDTVVDATILYEKGENGKIESALTPTFKSFSGDITVESKLNTLISDKVYYVNDDIYGIFDEFESGGCLFKCTYYTAVSSTDKIIKYESGWTDYYTKNENNEWVKTRTVKNPEHPVDGNSEIPAFTKENAYQVLETGSVPKDKSVLKNDFHYPMVTGMTSNGEKTETWLVEYEKHSNFKYNWCECVKQGPETDNGDLIVCGDGEDINFNQNSPNSRPKYRNLLMLGCVPGVAEEKNYGDYYYFMVKYDNGHTDVGENVSIYAYDNEKVLGIPYESGVELNVETYPDGTVKYDKILNIERNIGTDTIIVNYVIGATSGANINQSGIHYNDEFYYGGNEMINAIVDEYYTSEILYEKVEYTNNVSVGSDDLSLTRDCRVSEITGMEIGTQWTSGSSLRAYLFTDNIHDNLMEYPKINVDLSYNRGNAAAWESHFKLSECNSLEDLENNGNNYFNL